MNCQELSSTEFDILVLDNLEAHSHSWGTGEASGSLCQIIPTPESMGNKETLNVVSVLSTIFKQSVCVTTLRTLTDFCAHPFTSQSVEVKSVKLQASVPRDTMIP